MSGMLQKMSASVTWQASPSLLEESVAGQKELKGLEKERNQKRRSLFDAQDELDRQREELISRIEGKLAQHIDTSLLYTIHWEVLG